MHSRIIQISKEPINEDDYLSEDKYYDIVCGALADYVDGDTDRDDDIEWFIGCLGDSISYNKDEQSFTIIDKEKYFDKAFEHFQELLKKLSDTTLKVFSGIGKKEEIYQFTTDMYSLKSTYDDEFSFYIDDNGEYFGMSTIDNFMRNVENNTKFYIGTTIDYHF